MSRVLVILLIFFMNSSLADEELDESQSSFYRENLLEIMAYGFGAAEAIADIGEKSDDGKIRSKHEPDVYLSVVTETVGEISTKRIKKVSNETILAELNVTKSTFTIPFGGTLSTLTKEYVISFLGEPAEKSSNEYRYYVPSHIEDNILIITFEKEKAKSIKWVWWEP